MIPHTHSRKGKELLSLGANRMGLREMSPAQTRSKFSFTQGSPKQNISTWTQRLRMAGGGAGREGERGFGLETIREAVCGSFI